MFLLAFIKERITVFILLEVKIVEVCADIELLEHRTKSLISDLTEAILRVDLLCIEIRHTLAA